MIHIPGRDITILGTWSVQPPDSAVVATYDSVQGPRSTRRLIVAGARGWMQRDSQLTVMPNAILVEERHQFYLYALLRLLPLEAPGVRLTPVPSDSAGNAGILVESPGRLPVTMYFDRDARVARLRTTFATESGPGALQDIRLEGTIEANGVRWFRRMVIARDGQPYYEMALTDLQALARLTEPLLRGPPLHSGASAQRPSADLSTHVRPHQHVRLRLRDGSSLQGHVDPQHPNSASLLLRAPVRAVPYELVDSVWIRRTSIRNGAMIGGTVLGLAGFGRFMHLCFTGAGCLVSGPQNTTTAKWRAVSVMTLASVGTGALLGAIVGVLVRRWELSYARTPP